MIKTINLELSKRLNELWLLDNIETEYFWVKTVHGEWIIVYWDGEEPISVEEVKTLTLEEAIEFLPEWLFIRDDFKYLLTIQRTNTKKWRVIYEHINQIDIFWDQVEDTLLEAIEKMIEYLLDNNLLELWEN